MGKNPIVMKIVEYCILKRYTRIVMFDPQFSLPTPIRNQYEEIKHQLIIAHRQLAVVKLSMCKGITD